MKLLVTTPGRSRRLVATANEWHRRLHAKTHGEAALPGRTLGRPRGDHAFTGRGRGEGGGRPVGVRRAGNSGARLDHEGQERSAWLRGPTPRGMPRRRWAPRRGIPVKRFQMLAGPGDATPVERVPRIDEVTGGAAPPPPPPHPNLSRPFCQTSRHLTRSPLDRGRSISCMSNLPTPPRLIASDRAPPAAIAGTPCD